MILIMNIIGVEQVLNILAEIVLQLVAAVGFEIILYGLWNCLLLIPAFDLICAIKF